MNNGLKRIWVAMVFAALLVSYSCSQRTEEQATRAAGVPEIVRTEMTIAGPEKYVATLQIEGMGCEMMCGTKISGTLNGLSGVNSTEIDFKGEGQLSSAIVDFDLSMVSEAQMIEAIGSLSNGHYKVVKVNVVHYLSDSNSKGSTEEVDKKGISLKPDLGYRLPNIFGIFRLL